MSFSRRSSGKIPSFQKRCKFAKINIWSLVEYSKLIYLDSNLLIIKNIDELFHYDDFAAVKIVGDEFNTGLFVTQPSQLVFTKMLDLLSRNVIPSWYQGEQGFINWFFKDRPSSVISTRYNTVMRLKVTL